MFLKGRLWATGVCLSALCGAVAPAAEPTPPEFSPLSQALRVFRHQPATLLNANTEHRGGRLLRPRPLSQTHFIDEKIRNRCLCLPAVAEFMLQAPRPQAALDKHNQPEDFLGSGDWIADLNTMEAQGLKKSYLDESPWAGDYFPTSKGLLAARTFVPDFIKQKDWKARYEFVNARPLKLVLANGNSEDIDQLSVAEKYDALSGLADGPLTEAMWAEGKSYFDRDGKVEDWMGLCHGWAPASFSVPRPRHKVSLIGTNNRPLTLYPAEIKGLISLQWANNPYDVRFIGQRCSSKKPAKDKNGRLIEPGCFDVNPATWHIVTVNRIGLEKKSFVFDATFDYEVWNQPLYGYQYVYFNPRTGEEAKTLQEATTSAQDWKDDPFKSYRDPRTKSIVGIAMVIGYTIESAVNRFPEDSPDYDTLSWARYIYDLEIDGDGRLIGGEWYTNEHPDFLWAPRDGETAPSVADSYLNPEDWREGAPFPEAWRKLTEALSQHSLVPLAITSRLVKWSTQPTPRKE